MTFRFWIVLFSVVLFFSPAAAAPALKVSSESQVKRLLIIYTPGMAMDWTADGKLLLTVNFGTIRLWNAETLEERYNVKHGEVLNGILFNDSGDQFLSWSNSMIRTWDTATGTLLGTLAFDTNVNFRGVMWHGDQIIDWLGGTINLWDGISPDQTAGFLVPGENFSSYPGNASWNQDQTQFLSWGGLDDAGEPVVRMWKIADDFEDATEVIAFPHGKDPIAENPINGAAWSPDETMVASWSPDRVMIWDAATGELLNAVNRDSYVTNARWSPDSRYLLVEDIRENEARIWDVNTGLEAMTIPGTDAMWDTTGKRVIAGRTQPELLAVPSGAKLGEFASDMGLGYGIWNPDGIRLLVETGAGVQVWIIPPQESCVVHALSPANVRADPLMDAERIGTLPPHRIATVRDNAEDDDQVMWWQVESGWVRSDIVEETGDCS